DFGALKFNFTEFPLQVDDQAADPPVGNQQIRSGADEKDGQRAALDELAQGDQFFKRIDVGVIVGGAADAERGVPAQRLVQAQRGTSRAEIFSQRHAVRSS